MDHVAIRHLVLPPQCWLAVPVGEKLELFHDCAAPIWLKTPVQHLPRRHVKNSPKMNLPHPKGLIFLPLCCTDLFVAECQSLGIKYRCSEGRVFTITLENSYGAHRVGSVQYISNIFTLMVSYCRENRAEFLTLANEPKVFNHTVYLYFIRHNT